MHTTSPFTGNDAAGVAPDDPHRGSDDLQRRRRRELCRSLIRERHLIDRFSIKRFHANADFAMLLAVYLAEAEDRETYQYEVAQAATIVSSTAHRKLAEMIDLGILARKRTIVDRRRVCLVLTPDTRTMLETLLDRLAQARE